MFFFFAGVASGTNLGAFFKRFVLCLFFSITDTLFTANLCQLV